MPTITVDRKAFEALVGKRLPLEKLKERISYLGTDLESVTDQEITAEIFPNRPDMLSVQGFARAFSAFIGAKPGLREYKVRASGERVIIDKSVKGVRPFTACAIVKGIKYDDERIKEVIQVQEKLHITYGRNRRKVAIGIYPYEKISPPIRFIAMKPEAIRFQPLEFPRAINGRQILSMHPTGREYAHLLEGQAVYPVFIDSKEQILSMPPIINSHQTGKISYETTDVFIECSGFDFRVLQKCLNMIAAALADMGGKIYSMQLVYPERTVMSPDMRPEQMRISLPYVNTVLGLRLKERELKQCLERMGYGYSKGRVMIPAYRADILHQIDLAEDVAIGYGFDRFKPTIPNVATIGQEDPYESFRNRVADVLVGLGLLEVNTYNLTNRDVQCGLMNCELELVEIANSISSEFDVLRAWVAPSMLEVFRSNKHHEYPQRIFGFGTVFKKNSRMETNIEEKERLAVAICSDSAGYTEIRQVLDYLMQQLAIEYSIRETGHPSFIEGRVGRVAVKGKDVAYIGEIRPEVILNFGLEMPVAVLELDTTGLFG